MNISNRCISRLLQMAVSSAHKSRQISKIRAPALPVRRLTVSSCRLCGQEAEKDRRQIPEGKKGHQIEEVSVQESIKYMNSKAFKTIYGDDPVWKHYRRNFKGHFLPKPRVRCSFQGVLTTASPCPLCRDDYLVVDHKNVDLLKQFVSESTGEPLDPQMTGLCMKQHKHIKFEVARAQDYGLMEKSFHFRKYNYPYYQNLAKQRRKLGEFIEMEPERESHASAAAGDRDVDTSTTEDRLDEAEEFQITKKKVKDSRQNETADMIQKKYKLK